MSNYPPPPPPPPPSPPPPGQPQWGAPQQPQWGQPGAPQWAGQQQWPPPGQQWPTQGSPGAGARYAGFGPRFGAALLDGLVLSPLWIVAWIVLVTGKKEIKVCNFDATRLCQSPTGSTIARFWFILLLGFVAAILYYGLTEGRTGQSVGKRALGVKVLDARTGAPIGTGRAIGRYLGKIVSAIPCGLGYLWMLWDPNKQTWHDKMVGSYVVTA